ncbi:MAG: 50S ribosomal protein L6, partial [Chlorobi bacterium]|nr:50S ribosomal protein L6 [Chlorobiota bacterium]
MSRIGKLPINVPAGVTIDISKDNVVTVKGKLGELKQKIHPDIKLEQDGNVINVTRPSDSKEHKSFHGLSRVLVNNMVEGVSKG